MTFGTKFPEHCAGYPEDIDPPTVYKADADAQPIFAVSLRSGQRSLIDLSGYAERYYKERLQTIPGVSSVDIWGEVQLFRALAYGSGFTGGTSLDPDGRAVGR